MDLSGTVITASHEAVDGWGNNDEISNIEHIEGSGYNDSLYGNSGANAITGGDGADFLGGMGGTDTLSGGVGADTFYFHSLTAGTATISDYNGDFDKIGVLEAEFGVYNTDRFGTVTDATYSGGFSFGGGETSGFVYASVSGNSSGNLYYDDGLGSVTLLASFSETADDATPGDSNPLADDLYGIGVAENP